MRQLRREVEALGAALADMRAQRGNAGAGNPGARNPGVTGALAGLVPGSAGLLGGGFDRGRLLVGCARNGSGFKAYQEIDGLLMSEQLHTLAQMLHLCVQSLSPRVRACKQPWGKKVTW